MELNQYLPGAILRLIGNEQILQEINFRVIQYFLDRNPNLKRGPLPSMERDPQRQEYVNRLSAALPEVPRLDLLIVLMHIIDGGYIQNAWETCDLPWNMVDVLSNNLVRSSEMMKKLDNYFKKNQWIKQADNLPYNEDIDRFMETSPPDAMRLIAMSSRDLGRREMIESWAKEIRKKFPVPNPVHVFGVKSWKELGRTIAR